MEKEALGALVDAMPMKHTEALRHVNEQMRRCKRAQETATAEADRARQQAASTELVIDALRRDNDHKVRLLVAVERERQEEKAALTRVMAAHADTLEKMRDDAEAQRARLKKTHDRLYDAEQKASDAETHIEELAADAAQQARVVAALRRKIAELEEDGHEPQSPTTRAALSTAPSSPLALSSSVATASEPAGEAALREKQPSGRSSPTASESSPSWGEAALREAAPSTPLGSAGGSTTPTAASASRRAASLATSTPRFFPPSTLDTGR
jgi:hypothetical protein